MEINTLAIELEAWANRRWDYVIPLIVKNHRGGLLEDLDGITDVIELDRRLHNNTQKIRRAFRGDTPHYRQMAAMLAPAVRAAIDEEQAMRNDIQSDVATANRECIEATSAALMGKPVSVVQQEAIEAIYSLAKFLPGVTVQLVRTGQQVA